MKAAKCLRTGVGVESRVQLHGSSNVTSKCIRFGSVSSNGRNDRTKTCVSFNLRSLVREESTTLIISAMRSPEFIPCLKNPRAFLICSKGFWGLVHRPRGSNNSSAKEGPKTSERTRLTTNGSLFREADYELNQCQEQVE